MDVTVVPSICLSSLAGALLFFASGRLSVSRPRPEREPEPQSPALAGELAAERAARARAEEQAGVAWRTHEAGVAALAEERNRAAALAAELERERAARAQAERVIGAGNGADLDRARRELAAMEARAAGAERRAHELAAELEAARSEAATANTSAKRMTAEVPALRAKAAERDRIAAERDAMKAERDRAKAERDAMKAERDALKAERDRGVAELAKAREQIAALTARSAGADTIAAEIEDLRRQLAEKDRAPRGDLAELQRKGVEVAAAMRVLEQRSEEMARKEAENAELSRKVLALAAAEEELAELRRRVKDLEAQGFARRTLESIPADDPPSSRGALETTLENGLRDLVAREEGCRAAVLSDVRGLLIAAYGERAYRHELAAAASITTSAVERMRELLPLGEAASLSVVDHNDLVLRTRWLRSGEECFLLSTVGIAADESDPGADALCSRLAELIGAT
jgi:chromosome segregation ATPase